MAGFLIVLVFVVGVFVLLVGPAIFIYHWAVKPARIVGARAGQRLAEPPAAPPAEPGDDTKEE